MIAQILVVFEIWCFLWFFQKFSKLKVLWFFLNLKFPTLKLGTVRVLSKIANLVSKYDCSNPCSFRDMMFFVIFSKIFRKCLLIFSKFENPNPVVGSCQSNLKDCYYCLQIWLLNFFVLFEIWRFLWFFQKFSENLNFYYSLNIWNSQPCS